MYRILTLYRKAVQTCVTRRLRTQQIFQRPTNRKQGGFYLRLAETWPLLIVSSFFLPLKIHSLCRLIIFMCHDIYVHIYVPPFILTSLNYEIYFTMVGMGTLSALVRSRMMLKMLSGAHEMKKVSETKTSIRLVRFRRAIWRARLQMFKQYSI